MSTELLNSSRLAQRVRSQIQRRLRKLTFTPDLTVVQVGNAPASTFYIAPKQRDCEKVRFHSEVHRLPADTNQETVIEHIEALNARPSIQGMLVQVPLLDCIDKCLTVE